MLRRGIPFPESSKKELTEFKEKLTHFKEKDLKVKLESILAGEIRKYYIENRFCYLLEKIEEAINNI